MLESITPKIMSIIPHPSFNSPQIKNLNDAHERRKTLIIAATSDDILKKEYKNQDDDMIENTKQMEVVEEATQVEEVEDATQVEEGLLDFYRLLPVSDDDKNECKHNRYGAKENEENECKQNQDGEKKSEENAQGLTGLALLACSDNVSSTTSPTSNTPIQNAQNSLEYQTKLMVPSPNLIDYEEQEKYSLSINAESQFGSLINYSFNKQLEYEGPLPECLLKNKLSLSKSMSTTSIKANVSTTKTSLVIDESNLNNDLKLKYKAIDNSSYTNEHNIVGSIQPKTPRKSLEPDCEFQSQSFFKDDKQMQENLELKALKIGDELAIESNGRNCKEWFHERLWCFLFENLNRAIDELYFLCDLQGASEKITETILFLEEATQDFRELKSSVRVANVNAKKQDNLAQCTKNEESDISKTKFDVVHTYEETTNPKINKGKPQIQCDTTKNPKINVSEEKHEARMEEKTNDKKHIEHVNDTKPCSVVSPLETKLERFVVEKNLLMCADEKNFDDDKSSKKKFEVFVTEKKNEILHDHQIPMASKSIVLGNEEKHQKYLRALPYEVLMRPPHPESQRDNRDNDCRAGMIIKTGLSSFVSQPYTILQTPNLQERERPATFREKEEESDYLKNLPDRAASVIGYRVDEERRQWNELLDNQAKKQNLSKKKNQTNFTGRLMRPTESSSIRATTNIKIKAKEKLKTEIKNETWSSTTKCYNHNLKQKGSWLDALVTPQRGPSRCQSIDKQASAKNIDSNKIRNSIKKQLLNKCVTPEKNLAKDIGNESQNIHHTKSSTQIQEKSDYKLVHKKVNKSIAEQVQRRSTKTNLHEYDICDVEAKLGERLKQGVDKRLAWIEEVKNCVTLNNEGATFTKSNEFGNVQEIETILNKKSLHKDNIVTLNNVDDYYSTFIRSSFFHKQALKKKVKCIRLKLTNKKFEFLEPPSQIEGLGIGSATATGLAKVKIGKWMEELRRIQLTKDTASTILIISEIAKCLEAKHAELHVARQLGLLNFIATSIPLRQDPLTTLTLLQIQKTLLYLPANRSYFIIRNLLPSMVPMLTSSLEIFSTFGTFYQKIDCQSFEQSNVHESNEDKLKKLRELEILEGLLYSTISIMGHSCNDNDQLIMQDDLADLLVASGLISQLQNFFVVFDWQQGDQTPIPNFVILGLKLVEVLTGSKRKSLTAVHEEPINVLVHKCFPKQAKSGDKKDDHPTNEKSDYTHVGTDYDHHTNITKQEKRSNNFIKNLPRIAMTQKASSLTQSTTLLVSAISETGLVGLPSLLIGIILQIDPSSQEQTTSRLPSNFNEAATILLQVLNNMARLDLSLVQNKLALPDVCMEFYQLISFLLTYCTSNWKTTTDEIAYLLLETMMLIGYASLLHPENQAILRWGKNPTILQKMCNLPFVFFSDCKFTPILIGTLLPVCYGSEINRDVVQQQLSMEILLTFFKNSKTGLFQATSSNHTTHVKDEMTEKPNKVKFKIGKGVKNSIVDLDSICSSQRMSLPNNFFAPSKKMIALEKLRMHVPSPSSPNGSRHEEMTYCSIVRGSTVTESPRKANINIPCTKLSRSINAFDDANDCVSKLSNIAHVSGKFVVSSKLSNMNLETNNGSSITVVEPLSIAFALSNRFPKSLWKFAEDFFSSTTWMGQVVKSL